MEDGRRAGLHLGANPQYMRREARRVPGCVAPGFYECHRIVAGVELHHDRSGIGHAITADSAWWNILSPESRRHDSARRNQPQFAGKRSSDPDEESDSGLASALT